MKKLKNNKRYMFVSSLFFLILFNVYFFLKSNATSKSEEIESFSSNYQRYLEGIENFPSTYQPYLEELNKKHPNWNFTALYTNLNWNEVINKENTFGTSLVPINYSDSWKNTNSEQYNIEIDKGWVDSSRQAVEFCMDPRNFLNDVRIFQFEELSYNSNSNVDVIEKILYGTEFYNTKVIYLDSNGNTISMNEKYSDLIFNAAKISNVSPYHLASRIKQEVGPFLTHGSISGNIEGYEGLYNFYNIGATSSIEDMGAIKNGLQYAKDGNGASAEIRKKYLIPWNSKKTAITGGAIFIGSSYINIGQNTIYLQKFDVVNEMQDGLYWHQYMTNVLAPYTESKSIYNGYNKSGILDSEMNFIIPVYENMPVMLAQNPNIDSNDFTQDYTNVYCNATNVNIRTGPSTSYEIITTVSNPTNMIRIGKGNQSGERWDKIRLYNGIIGYIYQSYVTEIAEEIDIKFENPLKENNFIITGIDYNKNSVTDLKSKISTNYELQFLNDKNELLQDTNFAGTDSKIQLKENGNTIREYRMVLYGDANGDGKINSIDLLVLQRHILEIEQLDDVYISACDINKDNNKTNSIDLLLIQRHILGMKIIEQ